MENLEFLSTPVEIPLGNTLRTSRNASTFQISTLNPKGLGQMPKLIAKANQKSWFESKIQLYRYTLTIFTCDQCTHHVVKTLLEIQISRKIF